MVEESRRTLQAALKDVIERQGRFGALYSRSGEPLFREAESRRAGGPAAADAGGAGAEGAGYSDDSGLLAATRGRSERRFGTWQGRLPPELRLAGVRTLETQCFTRCCSGSRMRMTGCRFGYAAWEFNAPGRPRIQPSSIPRG